MSSDLLSNLFTGFYMLLAHNSLVIFYVFGALVSLLFMFIRPKRVTTTYFIAFLTLAFGFEYNKHIIEPLRNQTLATVAENPETHLLTQRLVSIFVSKLLPLLFFVLGWGLLFLAILLSLMGKSRKAVTTEKNV